MVSRIALRLRKFRLLPAGDQGDLFLVVALGSCLVGGVLTVLWGLRGIEDFQRSATERAVVAAEHDKARGVARLLDDVDRLATAAVNQRAPQRRVDLLGDIAALAGSLIGVASRGAVDPASGASSTRVVVRSADASNVAFAAETGPCESSLGAAPASTTALSRCRWLSEWLASDAPALRWQLRESPEGSALWRRWTAADGGRRLGVAVSMAQLAAFMNQSQAGGGSLSLLVDRDGEPVAAFAAYATPATVAAIQRAQPPFGTEAVAATEPADTDFSSVIVRSFMPVDKLPSSGSALYAVTLIPRAGRFDALSVGDGTYLRRALASLLVTLLMSALMAGLLLRQSRAREELRVAAERAREVDRAVSVALSSLGDRDEREAGPAVPGVLARFAPLLGAQRMLYGDVTDERLHARYSWPPGESLGALPRPLPNPRWSMRRVLENRTVVLGGQHELPPDADSDAAFMRAMGVEGVVVVPVVRSGEVVAFAAAGRRDRGEWSEDDVRVLLRLGQLIEGAIARARANSRRRRTETRFRQAMEATEDGLFELDVDSGSLYLSPGWYEMLGYAPDELAPSLDVWARLVHQEDASRADKIARELRSGTLNTFEHELRLRARDGEYRHVLLRGKRVEDESGDTLVDSLDPRSSVSGARVVGSQSDVSEQRRFEQALREARDHAEAAAQAKSDFLAMMSHEIRTPMNGVIGTLDLLRQTDLSREQRNLAAEAGTSGKLLLRVIDDVLDYSKIEAGKLGLEVRPTSLRAVIERAARVLRPSVLEGDLQLLVWVDPALPERLLLDEGRVSQVLINLIGNAVKFTRTRAGHIGQVRVDVFAAAADEANRVGCRIEVRDNGIGMSEEARQRLFRPFEQADLSTTRQFGGSGLGLAICARLVELMGGRIEADSELGTGSCFRVELAARIAPFDAPAASALAGISVALAGLDEALADVVGRYLAASGATVLEVASSLDAAGADAVVRAADNAPGVGVSGAGDTSPARPGQPTLWLVRSQADSATQGAMERYVGTDPVGRAAFVNAIAMLVGRPEAVDEEATGTYDSVTVTSVAPPSVAEAQAGDQLLLVAEDNLVNQRVIERQLALLGYACVIKADGVEALDAWRNGSFRALLTDIHMPRMDGYQLSQQIRDVEGATPARRMPIIAITANALPGEMENCRAAGMDDYLTKPVEARALSRILRHWIGAPLLEGQLPDPGDERAVRRRGAARAEPVRTAPLAGRKPAGAPPPTAASPTDADRGSEPTIDDKILRELVGDDDELVESLMRDFDGVARETAAAIHSAAARGDCAAAGAEAHKLKSSARAVGALALGEACFAIERAGKAGTLVAGDGLLSEFDARYAAVAAALCARGVDAAVDQ